jgi:hypothetical protein
MALYCALSPCSECLAERLVERLLDCLVNCLVDLLVDRLVENLIERLFERHVERLVEHLHRSGYGISINHLGMTVGLTMNNGMNVLLNVSHPRKLTWLRYSHSPSWNDRRIDIERQ